MDSFLSEELEQLPGGWFIDNGNLKKRHNGEIYFVFNPDWEKVKVDPVGEFNLYYDLWENFHYFGLPNGKGWANELPWVIDFLKMFNKIHSDMKSYWINKK